MRYLELHTISILILAVGSGCLPDDLRDTPGQVVVSLAPANLPSEVHTADGWEISFDRFWASLGDVDRAMGDCAIYSDNHYVRVVDILRPESQRLATLYALGDCRFVVGIMAPRDNAILGAGLDEEAMALMSAPGNDQFIENIGTAVHVAGTARQGERAITFAWFFRGGVPRPMCDSIDVRADDMLSIELRAEPSALFRSRADSAETSLRFEELAAADADGDGEVTLAELFVVSAGADEPFASAGERMYRGLVPEVVQGMNVELCLPRRQP